MSLKEKYPINHSCIYRECRNSSLRTPEKLWIKVPNEISIRNTWLKMITKKQKHGLLLASAFCEDDLRFPDGFKFGAATSAYQIEGAWNVSDKTASIWDTMVHDSDSGVMNNSTGDVACDSYHLWKEDVKIAKEMGLHFYRFSLSWPRILSTGFPNKISEYGVKYYNNLINELLANGIEPLVTIFHWDLPQRFQDLGGWANPSIQDWFSDYARVAYTLFGDRVQTWVTINEPLVLCLGYSSTTWAPRVQDPEYGYYLCNKHVLLAHAKAYRMYEREFKTKYHGKVGYSNHVVWMDPATKEDEELTELVRQHEIGLFSHPIFSKEGGWPPAVEQYLEKLSKLQGYPRSRLPAFMDYEIEMMRGAADFYALQHYTSRLVRKTVSEDTDTEWPLSGSDEYNATFFPSPEWKQTASTSFYVYPEGLRKTLVWLKEQYSNPDILITENGFATTDDSDREEYYREYLKQLLLAIKEDGVRVLRYTAWSLIDSFEWSDGYQTQYGLYAVDFDSDKKERRARNSAKFYAEVIKRHSLDV